jgi:hypothetical protein
MAIWNESLWPPSGYEFIDSENIRHVGSSLNDLISKVAAYRTRRGLPPGNPISEVNEYLCKLFPTRCKEGPASSSVTVGSTPSLATRITEWLRAVWLRVSQKQVEFVSEDEVKRRADICKACSLHAALPNGCAACAETFNHLSFQLRAGRDRYSEQLRVCSRYGTDLRVDVLVVQPTQADAPANCWKR